MRWVLVLFGPLLAGCPFGENVWVNQVLAEGDAEGPSWTVDAATAGSAQVEVTAPAAAFLPEIGAWQGVLDARITVTGLGTDDLLTLTLTDCEGGVAGEVEADAGDADGDGVSAFSIDTQSENCGSGGSTVWGSGCKGFWKDCAADQDCTRVVCLTTQLTGPGSVDIGWSASALVEDQARHDRTTGRGRRALENHPIQDPLPLEFAFE